MITITIEAIIGTLTKCVESIMGDIRHLRILHHPIIQKGFYSGIHRRISRHSLGGAEIYVALMTGICLSVFALISIMKFLFSYENLPFFALISSQTEC